MRLPRRVPWATLAELDQVCNWIFADEMDTNAKLNAINRLSAWRAITPLPHALEATLSLLSSTILDEAYASEMNDSRDIRPGQSSAPSARNGLALNIRQSYATAIIRLVNGLVDPLQLGTYARSISSIASQIGLPLWLVELRHAATHEDLPSLELLRTGARESLTWLLHNYFLPTLSASSTETSAPVIQLSPLQPLFKEYKSIMKTISRDASLKSQYKDELARTLRDIERWIGKAKIASSAVIFNGWGASDPNDTNDNERWALERLSDALIERDGLVPVSSRKRLTSDLKSPPVVPPALIAIWKPMLAALKANHPTFPSVLVSVIVEFLLNKPTSRGSDTSSSKGLSFDLCLAAWVAWCVDEWDTASEGQEDSGSPLRRRDIVVNLISALAIRTDETPGARKGVIALLNLLIRSHPTLGDISTSLLSAAQRDSSTSSEDSWTDEGLQTMEERLSTLLSHASSTQPTEDANTHSVMMDVDQTLTTNHSLPRTGQSAEMPRGWARIPPESWRPCPIGVF